MIKVLDMRKGRAVIYQDEIFYVKDKTHVTKGNKRSYIQAQLKNFKTGQIIDVRFNMDDRLDTPFMESKTYEYLYSEGDALVLMDTETYDQVHIDKGVVTEGLEFLKPNEQISCQIYEGNVIQAELPQVVELEVTDAPPVVRGATATNQPKVAELETGAKVRVPPFIETGERIRVDTRSGEYVERAK
jgi:elongation factor P